MTNQEDAQAAATRQTTNDTRDTRHSCLPQLKIQAEGRPIDLTPTKQTHTHTPHTQHTHTK